ncbi:uncharacterized protein [Henckelia pumila]|uniref:uncharacterized protein isoform X2 n=1 Tax=Henckelia pumila TaxID=405737 RepID=UPI003C6E3840
MRMWCHMGRSVWRYVMNLVLHLVDTESESFNFRIGCFCKQCLHYSAGKCGKRCPKCMQLISINWRYCTVNTVLWNTIQLLFPKEVEARKAVTTSDTTTKATREESSPTRTRNPCIRNTIRALNSPETDVTDSDRKSLCRLRSQSSRISGTSERGETSLRRSDFGLCLIMEILGCFMFEIQVIWEEMTILGLWDFPFAFLSFIR